MDVLAMAQTERGADLLRQWKERCEVVKAAAGDGSYAVSAIDLPAILVQILPIIFALLSGGFTPVALVALIPKLIEILFPNLDAGLVAILNQIIAFFVGK